MGSQYISFSSAGLGWLGEVDNRELKLKITFCHVREKSHQLRKSIQYLVIIKYIVFQYSVIQKIGILLGATAHGRN